VKNFFTKNMTLTKNIAFTAVFVVMGILLPMAFHAFALGGPIFLPMHIPAILAGLLLGSFFGLAVGVLSPLLSGLLTGMPVIYPMLPIMIVELALYGAFSGLFYKKLKIPIFLSLPIAMIIGRIGYGLMWWILLQINVHMAAPVFVAIQTGIPGIAIQLIIIPLIIAAVNPKVLKKVRIIFNRSVVKQAIDMIDGGEASLVIIKQRKIVHTDIRTGISAVLDLLENSPDLLDKSIVIDKVVGKAAASLFILGKAGFVYGLIMSRPAKSLLDEANSGNRHNVLVDVIQNRTKTGVCPIEQSIYDIFNPNDAITAIKERLEQLRNNT